MPVNITEELFAKIAVATFGDKIRLMHWVDLSIPEDGLSQEDNGTGIMLTITADEVRNAIKDWPDCYIAVQNKCPACGEDLTGFFGTFTWGLVHGHGFCGNRVNGEGERPCGQHFKYYHYFRVGNVDWRFDFFELTGLPRKAIEKYLEEHPEENETTVS